MDHITVPKVRRRDRRGWEPGIPSRCSAASPGTPSQLLECSLTPSSARDRSYIPRFTPRFTQTELSSPWDLLAGGCGTQRRGGSVPVVLLLDAASALGGSLPGPSRQAHLSRQEYWSWLPFSSPGDLPDPGTEPQSPALQTDSLPTEPPGKPKA